MQHARLIIRRIVPLMVLLSILVGATALLFGADTKSKRQRVRGKSIRFIQNKLYEEECASCHIAFLPGFLPDRSWRKLMDGLEDHFGENASLDKPINEKIKNFLITHAANSPKSTVRSKRIDRLISADEAPIRITETPFWTRKHYSVKGWVWNRESIGSKAKCDSCHRDAKKGIFSEYDVQVPEE